MYEYCSTEILIKASFAIYTDQTKHRCQKSKEYVREIIIKDHTWSHAIEFTMKRQLCEEARKSH